jgi:membrane dipeptidase
MRIQYVALAALILLLTACNRKAMSPLQQGLTPMEMEQLADELAHKYIITDGHVDLPYRLTVQNFQLTKEFIGIPIETDKGDFDYVRAKQGGLDAPFMSIFIPASYQQNGGAKAFADTLIDMVSGIAAAHPDNFRIVKTPDEVKACFQEGIIALPMGMENGAPVEDDLANVAYFRERGISYITLTHSKDNQICDSSYDTTRTWNGLSPFGYKVVREMNKQGIMVDISHVSDSTFFDVMEIVQTPVIASHSSCRVYTPGFERNMNDDQLRALAENGGVIQINFGSTFLDGDLQKYRNEKRTELRNLLQEKGVDANSEEGKALIEEFQQQNPRLYSTVQKVADHIDHVVKVAGIDYVGLGSDYDGVGDSLPTGLKDVSEYPNLILELLKRGYSEKDIEKICYANVFRVWEEVLAHAKANNG